MDFRALWLAVCVSTLSAAPNPEEIVRKSVEAIQSDWAQSPEILLPGARCGEQAALYADGEDVPGAHDRRLAL